MENVASFQSFLKRLHVDSSVLTLRVEVRRSLRLLSLRRLSEGDNLGWARVIHESKQEIGKFWPTVSNPPKSAITSALALAVRSSMLFGNLSSIIADTGSFGRISGD